MTAAAIVLPQVQAADFSILQRAGSRAAGLAMAFKLIQAAQDRRRAVNGPHLVALVRGAAERATLQRGLPLFAEKPLSADVAVTEEIAESAQRAGVITGTGYHWRCLDTVAHAVELLRTAPPLLATGYWLDKRAALR